MGNKSVKAHVKASLAVVVGLDAAGKSRLLAHEAKRTGRQMETRSLTGTMPEL